MSQIDWSQLEALLARDPAARGVPALAQSGSLAAAATSLAERGRSVAIVTGFYVSDEGRPTAETDGPPGALALAGVLTNLGMEVTLIGDPYTLPLLETGCDHLGLPRESIETIPFESGAPNEPPRNSSHPEHEPRTRAWIAGFFDSPRGRRLTHVIAIERAGPSHRADTLAAQYQPDAAPLDDFDCEVPPAHRDLCHNIRGESIHGHTAKSHRLFDEVQALSLSIETIGIGDGGNEIGLGAIRWGVLRKAIHHGPAGRVACRIATNHTILAGVSDWGGYALAAAVAILRGRRDALEPLDSRLLGDLIAKLVIEAGAVDGITRRREPTVDGLPLDEYLDVPRALVRLATA